MEFITFHLNGKIKNVTDMLFRTIYLLFVINLLFSCDLEKSRNYEAFDYFLKGSSENNIIEEKGEKKDVIGFRNLKFSQTLKTYLSNIHSSMIDGSDTVLGHTLSRISVSDESYRMNHKISLIPIYIATCEFVDDDLAKMGVSLISPSKRSFTREELVELIDFLENAYGPYFNFRYDDLTKYATRIWTFPSCTIEFEYGINYTYANLTYSNNRKKKIYDFLHSEIINRLDREQTEKKKNEEKRLKDKKETDIKTQL